METFASAGSSAESSQEPRPSRRWRWAGLLAAVVLAGLAGAGIAVQASASNGGSPGPISPTAVPTTHAAPARTQLAPAAMATNAHCGQIVTASLTLNGDLYCSGSALTINGNSINVNLGGHRIFGNDASGSVGVTLNGTSDTVQNGVVAFFYTGVQVSGSTDTVSAVHAASNQIGIADYGHGTKITNSVASSNALEGIYSLGVAGTYTGTHELNNGDTGLLLAGGNGTNMVVTSNVANGNAAYGIYDFGQNTKLTSNRADFNGRDGISVGEVAVIDGGGNSAKGNDYVSGVTPEQCYGIACS